MFDRNGRVLLVRHVHDGRWGAPGGGSEPNESPEETARREVQEETGVLLRDVELVGAFGGPDFEVVYEGGVRTAYVWSSTVPSSMSQRSSFRPTRSMTMAGSSRPTSAASGFRPTCR